MPGILDSLFGGDAGKKEDKEALDLQKQALEYFQGLTPPELEPVQYEDQQWLGDYAPAAGVEAQHVDPRLMDGTAFDNVQTDPRLEAEQMASLGALDDLIANGGRTKAQEANLQRTLSDVSAADAGRRGAILQNMQARGMGGSGMELLAQLQSNQAATDRASQAGLDINADAEQRALEAIMNRGGLAGNIRSQGFGEQAQKAAAKDAIAQFNASTVNSVNRDNANQAYDASKTNTAYTNDAAFANSQGRQTTANNNAAIHNQQTQTNQVDIPQQAYSNSLNTAAAKAGATSNYANTVQGVGNRKSAKQGAQQAAVLGTVGTLGGAILSDKRTKADVREVSPEEIDEFLAALDPKRYQYKDKPGQRMGVMAQDIEGTALGHDIVQKDDSGMRHLDTNNLLGAIVASLGHLNKKVK